MMPAGSRVSGGPAGLVAGLRRALDARLISLALRLLPSQKGLEAALEVYAGVREPEGVRESLAAALISKMIDRAASKLGVEEPTVREALSLPYVRRGVANLMGSLAEYGLTRPQRFLAPLLVVWDFTKRCNLRCQHCYAGAGPEPAPDELSLGEKMEVLRQLDEAGVPALAFSGGEPLASPDFWPVAAEAARRGFYVSVATNGTLLTRSVARRLREVGVRYVEVSLDSPNPEAHDRFRGVPGAWEAAVRGIRNAKAAGMEVGIATTATKHNYREIGDMVDLALELGADRLVVFNFVPTGRGAGMADADLSAAERGHLLEFLYGKLVEDNGLQVFSTSPSYAVIALGEVEMGGRNRVVPTHFADLPVPAGGGSQAVALAELLGGCGAGRIYCSVEHNGDVQPCVFLPVVVGNVLRDGFERIWRESPVLEVLRGRDSPDYACSSCPYRYVCGGCRARAYAYHGSVLGPDPGCPAVEVAPAAGGSATWVRTPSHLKGQGADG